MLTLEEPPTAIFAASDTQALGVLQAVRELGRRVPEDLSVIGFDDIEISEYLNLTTVRQPLFESGYRGIDLLLRSLAQIDGEAACQELPLELALRGSTAPPQSYRSERDVLRPAMATSVVRWPQQRLKP